MLIKAPRLHTCSQGRSRYWAEMYSKSQKVTDWFFLAFFKGDQIIMVDACGISVKI